MKCQSNEQSYRSNASQLVPVIFGTVLSFLALMYFSTGGKDQFEDIALGHETTSHYSTIGKYPIHCKYPSDGIKCIDGVEAREGGDLVLWLGNSQLHAINQYKIGDENAPPILFKKLQSQGKDLIAFSQPNANLQEHYVLFEYLQQYLDVKLLLLPLVFDDMRETGIRSSINSALTDDLREILQQSDIGKKILDNSEDNQEINDLAGLQGTIQEISESRLNDWLADNIELWQERPSLRGQFLLSLYHFRNYVFGIDANTKRKVIKGPYNLNAQALVRLLESAQDKGVKVVAYIAPLRDDVEIPYERSEYDSYKKHVRSLVTSAGQIFINHEGLVPGEYWGKKDATSFGGEAELDFMHFQASGHRMLADVLYAEIVGEL